jgi:hypothetical protein
MLTMLGDSGDPCDPNSTAYNPNDPVCAITAGGAIAPPGCAAVAPWSPFGAVSIGGPQLSANAVCILPVTKNTATWDGSYLQFTSPQDVSALLAAGWATSQLPSSVVAAAQASSGSLIAAGSTAPSAGGAAPSAAGSASGALNIPWWAVGAAAVAVVLGVIYWRKKKA